MVKENNALDLYKEYLTTGASVSEMARKYKLDYDTVRKKIIKAHKALKNGYGRYDISFLMILNDRPSIELTLARLGVKDVFDLITYVDNNRLSNMKGITNDTEGYILMDLSTRMNQLRKEIKDELYHIYDNTDRSIIPLTIICSCKELQVMAYTSKRKKRKRSAYAINPGMIISVDDKFYISCNDDLYDPSNPHTEATMEAKRVIYKKETKKYEKTQNMVGKSEV